MGIPIKYATTTPPNSLRKSNVAIGVNNVEYGPTNTTGWYNNINSPGNNIVIYKTQITGDPDAFAPQSDQELYNFVMMQGGSSSNTTSVGAALAWIATQPDLLAVDAPIHNIVTDGLVLNFNGGVVGSYPTTGTIWYDMCGQGNNGTLTNGPTFNANGWITFDGTNDRINLPSSIATSLNGGAEASLNMWVKLDNNSNSSGKSGIIQLSGFNNSNGNLYWYSNGFTYLDIFRTDRVAQVWANTVIDPRNWHMLTVTTTPGTNGWKSYLNGVLQKQVTGQSTVSVDSTIQGGLTLAENSGGRDLAGSIASCFIYDIALTQSEILQNYYQAPIVTNGLVFAVDAGNLVSYENGDTTTNSLVGSSTGTLNNGVGFDSANGGVFISDGTDDGILVPDDNTLDLSDFTLEAWVWWNQHKNYGSILCKGPGGTGQLFNYAFFFYSGNIVCGFGNGSSWAPVSISTPTINEWHHIVGTYDGSNLKFYLDGDLANTSAVSGTPYQNTTDLGLLHQPYPIDGKVGPLRIYNKALTADEVSQNFNAQRSRFI